ncbi:MAG: DNA-3-methyladenine glycosylase 2 family protein [Opitutaceae bacterium]|nr:DNA-3-methyladenine glycosylase 2 family protein [Opitutaceae bacterium]
MCYLATMRMTESRMYDRVLASDASYNGRFFLGVLTTGIYCLPGCGARKPKRENVCFFPTCDAARAAGLRACKKCHPDDFAAGADPVLESIETLVGLVRARTKEFCDAKAIVRRSGFGASRVFELFRLHYHQTPADLLAHARIAHARAALLAGNTPLTEVALEAGFESLSVFHDHFRRLTGLTPGDYRKLPQVDSFTVQLPDGYPLPYLRRALTRDIHSVTERLENDHYSCAVRIGDQPAVISVRLSPECVHVTAPHDAVAAHRIVIGLLGLNQDAEGFARLSQKLGLARLVRGRAGLRISQTHSVFEGLLWAIIGQQINFPFACQLRRRLIELTGTRLPNGLIAPPAPADVAALRSADLVALKFSRQKAAYVIDTARLIVDGKLTFDSLSATRAERTLLAIRGLGPWSVNYLMMRALGFADCVPYGDTGVTSGLQSLFKLEQRPDVDATRRLMSVFAPYRSLATAHLWQLNQPQPT